MTSRLQWSAFGHVVVEMDDHSLSQLVHDHEEDHLDGKIQAAREQ